MTRKELIAALVGRTIVRAEVEYGEQLALLLDNGNMVYASERMTGGQLSLQFNEDTLENEED